LTLGHPETPADRTRGLWRTWRGIPVRYVADLGGGRSIVYNAPEVCEIVRWADVIHITGIFAAWSMGVLMVAAAMRKPVVLSPRGALERGALQFGPTSRKKIWLKLFNPALQWVDVFHATSLPEANSIRHHFGPSVRVVVVPNGTTVPFGANSALGTLPIRPRIGFVGRLHPIKALERLIDSANLLRSAGHVFEMALAGPTVDSSYRRLLERRILETKLTGIVSLVGALDEVALRTFYESCRVVVIPSHSENFCNVVVEALAHGVPVVASRGTPWSLLEQCGAGAWVANDALSLAESIGPFLAGGSAAAEAGRRGRQLVLEHFGWDSIARAMGALYYELAETRSQGRIRGAAARS